MPQNSIYWGLLLKRVHIKFYLCYLLSQRLRQYWANSKKYNIFCGFFTLFSTKIIAFHVIVFVNLWGFSNARIVVSSISFHSAMREHMDILTLLWEDVVNLETEAVNWWSLLYCANLRNKFLDPFFSYGEPAPLASRILLLDACVIGHIESREVVLVHFVF